VKLLVTGARGQLGRALEVVVPARGHGFLGVDLPEVDIADAAAVARLVRRERPGALVNCAAFTAVDAAEEHEDEALAVNGTAVAGLAAAAEAVGAVLVQISTDYVFDGRSSRPYREDDAPAPLSAYGRSKLAGEVAARGARHHLVVRTAWLFGEGGRNFVEAIRTQVRGGAAALRVVDDQRGSPTYAADLADAIVRLLEGGARGVIHAVNDGVTTWAGLAREIVARIGATVEIVPITAAELARPAPRPANSHLDTGRLTGLLGAPLPPWQDAVRRYLEGGAVTNHEASLGEE
jgi:dTDP-4-dehydrorhamnose reductase